MAQPPENVIIINSTNVNGGITTNNGTFTNLDSIKTEYIIAKPLDGDAKLNSSKDQNDKLEEKKQQMQTVIEYKAMKSQLKSNPSSRSVSYEQQNELDKKVQEVQAYDQEDENAKIIYYDAGNYNAERSSSIKQVLESSPNNEEALTLWTANSIVIGDTNQTIQTLQKMESLNFLPRDVTCYAQDMNTSIQANTVFITHGKWDTYGFLNEQFKVSDKKGVINVSLDLLQSPQYRELLTDRGLNFPGYSNIDTKYLGEFCALNPKKKFAFSMTIPKEYLGQFQDFLVPNGVLFMYNTADDIDGIVESNEFLENRLNFMECGQDRNPYYNGLNANYLPMLMFLENYYLNDESDKNKKKNLERVQNKKIGVLNKMKANEKKGP